jgi:hypothetical protein
MLAMQCGAKVIGINNRDLTTFRLDLSRTETLTRYAEFTFGAKVDDAIWPRPCLPRIPVSPYRVQGRAAGAGLPQRSE